MKIMGTADIKTMVFEDLKHGDVFFFTKDFVDGGLTENSHIYMRCGHVSTDKTAVNLKTGNCYNFADKEPVELLDATLSLKLVK